MVGYRKGEYKMYEWLLWIVAVGLATMAAVVLESWIHS